MTAGSVWDDPPWRAPRAKEGTTDPTVIVVPIEVIACDFGTCDYGEICGKCGDRADVRGVITYLAAGSIKSTRVVRCVPCAAAEPEQNRDDLEPTDPETAPDLH